MDQIATAELAELIDPGMIAALLAMLAAAFAGVFASVATPGFERAPRAWAIPRLLDPRRLVSSLAGGLSRRLPRAAVAEARETMPPPEPVAPERQWRRVDDIIVIAAERTGRAARLQTSAAIQLDAAELGIEKLLGELAGISAYAKARAHGAAAGSRAILSPIALAA
ncbi:MAG: hypothetical protein R3D33_00795 [Hyphomicrobiaceae bacterium]